MTSPCKGNSGVIMSDLCLVASMLAKMQVATQNEAVAAPSPPDQIQASPKALQIRTEPQTNPQVTPDHQPEFSGACGPTLQRVYAQGERSLPVSLRPQATPQPSLQQPEFVPMRHTPTGRPATATTVRFSHTYQGPQSGPQLYQQRRLALQQGRLYTRLPSNSFRDQWAKASSQPTYEQWKQLLAQEARAVSWGQGNNHLSVMVGDSLSLWLPTEALPPNQLWLNQGISGDTTSGILQRLDVIRSTRADTIYLMAGINDLRRGATDNEVLWNLRLIMRQLKADHPQAQIFVQSLLPTAIGIPNDRIRRLNQRIAALTQEEGVQFLDLYSHFADARGDLRPELTTDGLHLSAVGYGVWQSVLREVSYTLALAPTDTLAS